MRARLKGLNKSFGDRKVVSDLDLEIQEGSIVCLLGPSGCGKTTTLRMIGGFIRQDSGEIWVDDKRIDGMPPEMRPVATVFQSYALFPNKNVIGNVSYGLSFQGYSRHDAEVKAKEYLKLVGLEDYATQNIRELSGGQQQRVALARSLVINPRLLLMDEPLSNLDAKLRVQIREELKELQKKLNMTIVFVTHDQEEAMALGDRIAIMNDGKVEQIGTPDEVYRSPSTKFVMDFLGKTNCIVDQDSKERIWFRPESIQIDENGKYRAMVLSKEFQGFYNKYILVCGDEHIVLRTDSKRTYKEGEMLTFSITPEDVLLKEMI